MALPPQAIDDLESGVGFLDGGLALPSRCTIFTPSKHWEMELLAKKPRFLSILRYGAHTFRFFYVFLSFLVFASVR